MKEPLKITFEAKTQDNEIYIFIPLKDWEIVTVGSKHLIIRENSIGQTLQNKK